MINFDLPFDDGITISICTLELQDESGLPAYLKGVIIPLSAINKLTDEQIAQRISLVRECLPLVCALEDAEYGEITSRSSPHHLKFLQMMLQRVIQHPALATWRDKAIRALGRIEGFLYEQQIRDVRPTEKDDPRPGFVYLLRAETGQYKIGRTKNLETRQRSISLGAPCGIDLIHNVASQHMWRSEKALHERFAQKRLNGEWFQLTANDVEWIKSLHDLRGDESW